MLTSILLVRWPNWVSLMSQKRALAELEDAFSSTRRGEKQAQTALERYWWLLLRDPSRHLHYEQGVYSQVPIGLGDKEYVPDFMVSYLTESFSDISTWILIELEPPGLSLLTKRGDLAKRIRSAYEQVLEWHQWLQDHHAAASDLFWSVNRVRFEYCIFASRRSLADENVWTRIPPLVDANRHLGLRVRTYDSVLERAASFDRETWSWYEQSRIAALGRDHFKKRQGIVYDRKSDKLLVADGWR